MEITIHIPDDLAKLAADRVAKYEEPETVKLSDGRVATTTRLKYTGPDPLKQWIDDGVLQNLLALAPDWFNLQAQTQAEEIDRQRKLQEAAAAKLKGGK